MTGLPNIENDGEAAFQTLIKNWNDAEATIKRAEQVSSQIVMPSIVELRYAGRRIIDYYSEENASRKVELLRDANFNVMRAKLDAIDAIVSTISINVNKLIEKRIKWQPSDAIILKETMDKLSKVHNILSEARRDRNTRHDTYENVSQNELSSLISSYNKLRATSVVYANNKKLKSPVRLSFVVGILGFLIAIVSALLRAN